MIPLATFGCARPGSGHGVRTAEWKLEEDQE